MKTHNYERRHYGTRRHTWAKTRLLLPYSRGKRRGEPKRNTNAQNRQNKADRKRAQKSRRRNRK